jgi:integrase
MARHGENIHKRQDGRWEGRYIKSKNSDGKAIWGYVYGHSYNDVKKVLIRVKAQAGDFSLYQKSSTITFAALTELWLFTLQDLKDSTKAHYQYSFDHYILPVMGKIRLSQLSKLKIELCLTQIISPLDGSHKPYGTSVSRECISLVNRLCKYAHSVQLMESVEVSMKPTQTIKEYPEALSIPEQEAVCRFVYQHPNPRQIGILLMLQLGLRISEVCGLQWGDIDLNNREIHICRGVRRISDGSGKTALSIQSPKTKTSDRILPIPQRLSELLSTVYSQKKCKNTFWFLSGTEKRPVEPRCYRKSVHSYLAKAGVHDVNPHMLRHTFATTCLQSGCDVKTLSELMGHSNPTITLKRYVHTDMDRKRAAIELVFGSESNIR